MWSGNFRGSHDSKGFHLKWIDWINGCVRDSKVCIFINGKTDGRILASGGIRQGDWRPTISFHFLIVR